ncbi:hypothetical protein KC887_00995 [Candidatus Kaiserbacteria bacterium]|nr:hypothetical protein [Candidatus Kaiserbacteria bacterium]
MQKIYLLGAILFAPMVTLAHDGEHVTTMWYQEPSVIVTALVATLALCVLAYGWFSKKKNLITVPAVALVLVAVVSLVSFGQGSPEYEAHLAVADFGTGQSVTLYKSPNCGCCSGHAEALRKAGFDVTIELTDDLASVKQSHNIPLGGESCHTSVIGDYVVEGHVPLEAIEKLLTEKPDIAGIGLPGMPIGTPGMPGKKTAPYEVYQLSDQGAMSPYVTI